MSITPPSSWFLRLFLVGLGLVLEACSPRLAIMQPETFSRTSAETMQARLLDVSYPLLTAAADWCPFDQEPTYGFLLRDGAGGEGPESISTPVRALVSYVHPRLPAAVAGLSLDDVMASVNTVHVSGESAEKVGRFIGRLTRAKIQPLQLEVVRGGEPRTIVMSAIPACHYSMHVLQTDVINGITDGRRIGITRGATQLFTSDDELGWVVAHEIAHNILSHSQNMKLQAMMRTFLAARGQGPDSPDKMPARPSLESQADYVGAYLMARAGYDLSAIKRVWEWLERQEPVQTGEISGMAHTHPSSKDRLAALEDTVREIEAVRRLGQPLDLPLGSLPP